ncbi:hypothetical protein [Intestinibacter sp.]|uniref:hypothetical protein n=1 Tax=Intestinibacter sp. TaxID=1965304 RepID=UPI002A766773|nr:hypothetical protein [Intestinibacter sp.]MDY2735142.1 hypothetical protein [Intestinibacter sp.]
MILLNKKSTLLNKIRETLESFDIPVYYGKSLHDENLDWNYFVFRRKGLKKSGTSKKDFNYNYFIHIVMEDFIEDGFEQEVIKAITDNTTLKLVDTEHPYDYLMKNNTDQVVEVLTLEFTKFKKGCAINE